MFTDSIFRNKVRNDNIQIKSLSLGYMLNHTLKTHIPIIHNVPQLITCTAVQINIHKSLINSILDYLLTITK